MEPLVSILMPSKNNHEYIIEAVRSVINQTYKNWELIIVDDNSFPPLTKFLQELKDNRIKIFRLDKNLGISYALNTGLKKCTGKYIVRFDSDDICTPDRLEFQVFIMEHFPNIGVLGCSANIINGSNVSLAKQNYTGFNLNHFLLIENFLIHPTVIMKKKILDKYNLNYNEKLINAEDYDLWIRISKFTEIANLPKIILYYRVHENSQTARGKLDQLDLSLKVQRDALKYSSKLDIGLGLMIFGYMKYFNKLLYFKSLKHAKVRTIITRFKNLIKQI